MKEKKLLIDIIHNLAIEHDLDENVKLVRLAESIIDEFEKTINNYDVELKELTMDIDHYKYEYNHCFEEYIRNGGSGLDRF